MPIATSERHPEGEAQAVETFLGPSVGGLAPTVCDAMASLCCNDVQALAIIGARKRHGAQVPQDVSVVGFNGLAPGRMLEPTLAGVAHPARRMGERARTDLSASVSAAHSRPAEFLDHAIRRGGSLGPAPRGPAPIVAAGSDRRPSSQQESA